MSPSDAGASGAVTVEHGWFFVHAQALPEAWKSRAVPVYLLPMMPSEALEVLLSRGSGPALDDVERRIAALVARGANTGEIAKQVQISARSVQRHIARLKKRTGATTRVDLVHKLSSRGFGTELGTPDPRPGLPNVSQEGEHPGTNFNDEG